MPPHPKLRPRNVDMSPETIEQRLRDVSELNYLCMILTSAKRLGTVAEVRAREQPTCENCDRDPRDNHPQIAQSDAD